VKSPIVIATMDSKNNEHLFKKHKNLTSLSEFVWYNEIFIGVVEALDNMTGVTNDVVIMESIKERHWHCSARHWLHCDRLGRYTYTSASKPQPAIL